PWSRAPSRERGANGKGGESRRRTFSKQATPSSSRGAITAPTSRLEGRSTSKSVTCSASATTRSSASTSTSTRRASSGSWASTGELPSDAPHQVRRVVGIDAEHGRGLEDELAL